MKSFPILLAAVALACSSCAVGPRYRSPTAAAVGLPVRYAAATSEPADDLSAWWRDFSDPVLDDLVARTRAGNLDLAAAAARLREADAAVGQARGGLFPSLSTSADGSRTLRSPGPNSSSVSNGAAARWEIDLFGRIRRGVEAAQADLARAGYSRADIEAAVSAETARAYIRLRAARVRLAIARDELSTQDETLKIARFRAEAGLISGLDVEQARAQREQTAASVPLLEEDEAATRHRLSVLAGAAPGTLDGLLTEPDAIPLPPPGAGAGLPADLLRRRPDVRAAERALAAATARLGVAEAERLPSFVLSGDVGSAAGAVRLLGDSWVATLAASVSQPLFNGGALRAAVRRREAVVDEELAAYRSSVLGAIEDVENAAVAREASARRTAALSAQVDAATAAATLARANYAAGLTDFQRLLDAERTLLQSRDGLASAQADAALAAVELYSALGGGWSGAGRT